jgi:two-component system chemotaxis sensor kinase CheA
MKRLSGFGKYGTIIVSIGLFLVFDLGVLILNFYISTAISKDAVGVNLAGRQRMLSQRTVKALLETQTALQTGENLEKPLEELRKAYLVFDGTLRVFSQGGEAAGGDGRPVQLDAAADPASTAAIAKAYAIWTPYREKLLPVVNGEPDRLEAVLPEAVAHARANNVALLGLMNDLTTALEKVASAKADRLRLIQAAGITLALINFLIILLHFIRRLRASDALTEAARQETQDILESVSEGLFLLDREARIGHEHSKSLETIFQGQDLAHRNFLDLLRPLVTEKVLRDAADYLGILFKDHVNLKLVATINPLDQVQVLFGDGEIHKYLAFQFTRVHNKDRSLSHLLVTVKDITAQVLLGRQLEQSRQQAEEQMAFLLAILHIDPESLRDFLDRAEHELKRVNHTLKQYGEHRHVFPKQYRLALLDIFPIVHGVKGEAALLGLSLFEARLHAFEDVIGELRGRSGLNGDHLLSLTIQLDKLLNDVQSVREMVDRLTDLRNTFAPDFTAPAAPAIEPALPMLPSLEPAASLAWRNDAAEADSDDLLLAQLKRLTQQMASAEGKKVNLVAHGFDTLVLSGEQKAMLRDILVQLVRNAVSHGIETPAERAQAGKSSTGLIRVQAKPTEDQGCRIICHDDGRGISGEQLRQAAVRSGHGSADELAHWDDRRLHALLFEPGFSTAEKATLHAGRGIGMEVIKQKVEALGGQLALSTQPSRFCAWSITLPSIMALDHLEFETI